MRRTLAKVARRDQGSRASAMKRRAFRSVAGRARGGAIARWRQPAGNLDILRPIGEFAALMKRTYQPKKRRLNKTHGFLKRSKSPGGRNVLKRRRAKGRKRLAPSAPKK